MVKSPTITRFLCMLGMAAALVLLTGCVGGPGGGPGTVVSLSVSASDPKAEVIAIDWFAADQADELINPPFPHLQPPYSGAVGVPTAVSAPDWLPSAPLLLQAAQTPQVPSIADQPLPPPVFGPVPSTAKPRPPYHTQSGTGKLAFQGHLQGGLVIARNGGNVAAASLVMESLFNHVTGYCAVQEKAPADTTDRGRVTEEGVRLALPARSGPPNAVLFVRGYGRIVTIDGQKRLDPFNPSIFSLAPGTHSVRIWYSRQETIGNMIHHVWLPREVEVTFALPPGRVYVLEAFDNEQRVHIDVRDATNKGNVIQAQFRNVE